MSYQQLKKKTEGFTIIEVLIVLAIAGLIMLIVFLAVPALQRNSRNTAIRNDASNLAGAISDYAAANNGKIPAANTVAIDADGKITVTGASGTNAVEGRVKAGTAYKNAAVTTSDTAGTISYVANAKCDSNGTNTVASNRAIAVLYIIETGQSSKAVNCIDG